VGLSPKSSFLANRVCARVLHGEVLLKLFEQLDETEKDQPRDAGETSMEGLRVNRRGTL
jgi:hypothetical protein